MLYMVTFTISIPQMLAYIPYMDPMGYYKPIIDRLIIFLYISPCCSGPLGPVGPRGFSEEVHRQQLRQSAPWRSELRIADGLGRTRPWRRKT
jgi:hypothetical protein